MTLKEKIEELKKQIAELEKEVIQTMKADFYATHGLTEGQHFMYAGRECIGVEKATNVLQLKALALTANGDVSKKGVLIDNSKPVKPL